MYTAIAGAQITGKHWYSVMATDVENGSISIVSTLMCVREVSGTVKIAAPLLSGLSRNCSKAHILVYVICLCH